MLDVCVKKPIKASKWNSLSITIPMSAIKKLGLTNETPVQISLVEEKIIITKFSGQVERF